MKHPEVKVRLTGTDGNVFGVIGKVQREMKRAKVPSDEIKQFVSEATSGDYDNALQTCMKWVDVS